MAYATIKYGSRGSDVSNLQSTLNGLGYNLSVDGIFGNKTQAAVRDFQSKNGLSVDGIVGVNTWGKLNSGSSPSSTEAQAEAAPAQTQSKPDYSAYEYDPSGNQAYQDATAALKAAQNNKPVYADSYSDQIQEIYDKIMNREDFTYDLNSDMLYQQMKDQYTDLGRQAMQDTMGQAAGLTGGYGSSYAQSVGQQQYDAYLKQLNDNIPEYYQLARDAYDAEGDRLLEQYQLTGDLRDDEYNKYRDSVSDYWTNVDYLTGRADTEYDRGSENFYHSYDIGMSVDEMNYEKQQNAYDNLVSLIGSTGYTPTAEELAAAGMSESEAAAWRNAYVQANTPKTSSGGGSSKKSSSKKNSGSGNDDTTTEDSGHVKTLYQQYLNSYLKNAGTNATTNYNKLLENADSYAVQQLKKQGYTEAQINSAVGA